MLMDIKIKSMMIQEWKYLISVLITLMMARHQSVLWISSIRQVINMSLNKLILNIALKIVDILTFWVKKDKKRITFVSLTQSHLASDFKLIDDLLKKENKYHIHYNLIEFEKNLLGDFKYFLNCLKHW